ncbi:hypothetical protein O181_022491 [Austropuccinia psidii MF-1]|uniref:Uncharacterized protein n=1 Tax=Austropuccinia psidii MF-1 TaxID=1389203 RepID=A0A9Q3CCY8_9BASI|nr:hypothetical protein [Austropuccinia psidii MF-1]
MAPLTQGLRSLGRISDEKKRPPTRPSMPLSLARKAAGFYNQPRSKIFKSWVKVEANGTSIRVMISKFKLVWTQLSITIRIRIHCCRRAHWEGARVR